MQAAVADIKKLGASLSGLIAFAEEIDKLGSLTQAADEANARIKACAVKESEAKQALEVAQLALEDVKNKAQNIINLANAQFAASVAKAKDQAAAIVSVAKLDAEAIVSAAHGKKIDLELQVQSLQEKKAYAQADLESVQAVLAPLKAELDALKAKLGA